MGGSYAITFVVFDGVKMLDVVGPAEVFAEANKLGASYSLNYISPSGEPVSTSIGVPLPVGGATSPLTKIDTLMVPGGDDLPSKPIPTELIEVVQSLERRCRRIAAICTGAFILAKAGLLDQRQATTHWQHTRLLAASYPAIQVHPDALFVADGAVFTSAGVSAGIDLALALVERDHGASLARLVAQRLVLFMQRAGGQSQFSAPLSFQTPKNEPLRKAVELISARPDADYSSASLAQLMGLSPRQVLRVFAAEFNTSPTKFVEQIRLDRAKAMLAAGQSITKTAAATGFGSPETLRRVFNHRVHVSPSEYRARFHTARFPDEAQGQLQPE
ncbi:GlxA family transcriptional regulator [Paenarthrobacter ilicis]|uniref:GlxA family transcriptional regulator n=1 Tax=Paenarthrobacter ilicis TaxID=43665 RepID=UPI0028D856F1|nr:GlxA family transcriptional regulator [Paenarthrobacter ilicis]